MEAIIIDNKIQLIEDSTHFEINVICPRKNIQKMLDITKGKLLSKTKIELSFHHRAGETYEVKIIAKYRNVKQYLKPFSIYVADNKTQYLELISVNSLANKQSFAYSLTNCCSNQITGLYAFGDCSNYEQPNYNTLYYYADGSKSISLANNQRTNFGKKRYIKNNGKWASNRKF